MEINNESRIFKLYSRYDHQRFYFKNQSRQIENYKKLYPNEIKWELGFEKAIKEYARNKTRTEHIIEEIYKFMKQENLLGDFDAQNNNLDNDHPNNSNNNVSKIGESD